MAIFNSYVCLPEGYPEFWSFLEPLINDCFFDRSLIGMTDKEPNKGPTGSLYKLAKMGVWLYLS